MASESVSPQTMADGRTVAMLAAGADAIAARLLADALAEMGWRVVYGEPAAATVLVWSANTGGNASVLRDARRASAERRLAVVVLAGAPPMADLVGAPRFLPDEIPPDSAALAQLDESLRAMAGRRRLSQRQQRWLGAGIMALAAGALGLGLFALTRPSPPDSGNGRDAAVMEAFQAGKIGAYADAVDAAGMLEMRAFVASAQDSPLSRAIFKEAAAQLVQDPDDIVRAALAQATAPSGAALNGLWRIAASSRPSRDAAARVLAALAVSRADTRAAEALDLAGRQNPSDANLWRLLASHASRRGQARAASGATAIAEGLDLAAQGDAASATERLEAALRSDPPVWARGMVLGRLGDLAADNRDYRTAASRYRAAVAGAAPQERGMRALDAAKLARVLQAMGDGQEACAAWAQAERLGAEPNPDERAAACTEAKTPAARR